MSSKGNVKVVIVWFKSYYTNCVEHRIINTMQDKYFQKNIFWLDVSKLHPCKYLNLKIVFLYMVNPYLNKKTT